MTTKLHGIRLGADSGTTSGAATSANGSSPAACGSCSWCCGAILLARFINWAASKIVRRIDADFQESDALVRSESAKHRQAVASVISWVSIALLCVVVLVEITDILAVPVGSLVAPAAVLGAALGFGAQRHRAGPAERILHHHREAVRLRRLGSADDQSRAGRRRGHGRGRHVAGHQAALHRGRDVHHPQRRRSSSRSTCPRTGRAPSSTSRCRRRPTSTRSTTVLHEVCESATDDHELQASCCSTRRR